MAPVVDALFGAAPRDQRPDVVAPPGLASAFELPAKRGQIQRLSTGRLGGQQLYLGSPGDAVGEPARHREAETRALGAHVSEQLGRSRAGVVGPKVQDQLVDERA